MRAALLLAALVSLAALPQGEANAHMAAWRATGPAVAASGEVYLLEVVWHGTCTSRFTATLRDGASGAVLEERVFLGGQVLAELPVPALAALNPEAFLVAASSSDPAVEFSVLGVQAFTSQGLLTETQALQGTYRGLRVALVTVLASWTFC